MKKKRIGNTLQFVFKVTTNGEQSSLADRDIKVFLRNPRGVQMEMYKTITDTNKITATFEGKDQQMVGVYWIEVYENRGKANQAVIDFDAVELVARTKNE